MYYLIAILGVIVSTSKIMLWSEFDHDDGCDDSIGGFYDYVVGVSNIIYDLGLEADAGVCFGVVATQYVNGIMPHYIFFNVEASTFAKMANIHMAFVYDVCVCLLLPFIQ